MTKIFSYSRNILVNILLIASILILYWSVFNWFPNMEALKQDFFLYAFVGISVGTFTFSFLIYLCYTSVIRLAFRLEVDDKWVHFHSFLNSKRFQFNEIAGYRLSKKGEYSFFDSEGATLFKVSSYFLLQKEEFFTYFLNKLNNLDEKDSIEREKAVNEELTEQEALLQNIEGGEEGRKKLKENLKGYVIAYHALAIILLIYPFTSALPELIYLYPLATVWLIRKYSPWLRLFATAGGQYYFLIIGYFIFAFSALRIGFDGVESDHNLLIFLPLAIGLAIIPFYFLYQVNPGKASISKIGILILLIANFIWSVGTLNMINHRYDFVPGERIAIQIDDKDSDFRDQQRTVVWGHPVGQEEPHYYLDVTDELYDSIQAGDTVFIEIHQGVLGSAWYNDNVQLK